MHNGCSQTEKRFSLLLLEPGEVYFEDHEVQCWILPDRAATKPHQCRPSSQTLQTEDNTETAPSVDGNCSTEHTDTIDKTPLDMSTTQYVGSADIAEIPAVNVTTSGVLIPVSSDESQSSEVVVTDKEIVELCPIASGSKSSTGNVPACSIDKSSSWRNKWQNKAVRGQLKICSKSIVFEADISSVPVLRIPLQYCDVLHCANGPITISCRIEVLCRLTIEMLQDAVLQPYTFTRPSAGTVQHYVFEVVPTAAPLPVSPSSNSASIAASSSSSLLPHLSQLHRAASLPPNEHNTMVCAIARSIQSRCPFDLTLLRVPSEEVLLSECAQRITPLLQEQGRLVLTKAELCFQPFSRKQAAVLVPVGSILDTIQRRYLMQAVAIEVSCHSSSPVRHLLLAFKTEAVRNALHDLLLQTMTAALHSASANLVPGSPVHGYAVDLAPGSPVHRHPTTSTVPQAPSPSTAHCPPASTAHCPPATTATAVLTPPSLHRLTYSWVAGAISNYDYLLAVNSRGGRSSNDLTQYPVFPWVLRDYSSSCLDLQDPAVYRDLTRPIGALNALRLSKLKVRLRELGTNGRFLYGSHYSTPGFVLFYLVRSATSLALCLHNGRFDHPDRMFNSIRDTYHNVTHNPSDFKELIPEFYDTDAGGGFLRCSGDQVHYGTRQDGRPVGDVELPPWANSPRQLVRMLRAALESDHVSGLLHRWIDLIFGYQQRGEEAIKADNLFHPMSYEGAVDLAAVRDLNEREALEVQIAEFGQVPQQVFGRPHPRRCLALGLYDALYLSDWDEDTAENVSCPGQLSKASAENAVHPSEMEKDSAYGPSHSSDSAADADTRQDNNTATECSGVRIDCTDSDANLGCDNWLPNNHDNHICTDLRSKPRDLICNKCGCNKCFVSSNNSNNNVMVYLCSNDKCNRSLKRKLLINNVSSYLCDTCRLTAISNSQKTVSFTSADVNASVKLTTNYCLGENCIRRTCSCRCGEHVSYHTHVSHTAPHTSLQRTTDVCSGAVDLVDLSMQIREQTSSELGDSLHKENATEELQVVRENVIQAQESAIDSQDSPRKVSTYCNVEREFGKGIVRQAGDSEDSESQASKHSASFPENGPVLSECDSLLTANPGRKEASPQSSNVSGGSPRDSPQHSTSGSPGSSSKLQDLFTKIKSSTLKKSKKEKQATNLDQELLDWRATRDWGDGHPNLLPLITGFLIGAGAHKRSKSIHLPIKKFTMLETLKSTANPDTDEQQLPSPLQRSSDEHHSAAKPCSCQCTDLGTRMAAQLPWSGRPGTALSQGGLVGAGIQVTTQHIQQQEQIQQEQQIQQQGQLTQQSWQLACRCTCRLRPVTNVASSCSHTRAVAGLCLMPKHLATLSAGPIVKVLALDQLNQVNTRRIGDFFNSSCLFFPSLDALLIASHDSFLYSYWLPTSPENKQLTERNERIFNTTSNTLYKNVNCVSNIDVSASPQKGDVSSSGYLKTELQVHSDAVTCMAYANGKLFTGSTDGKVRIWKLSSRPIYAGFQTGQGYWKTCNKRTGRDMDFIFSETTQKCNVNSSLSKTTDTLDPYLYQCCCKIVCESDSFTAPKNYEETEKMYVDGSSYTSKMEDLISVKNLEADLLHDSPVTCLSLGCVSDGREEQTWLAVGLKNGDIAFWSLGDTNAPKHVVRCHSGDVTVLCWWSGDDDYIDVAMSEDNNTESVYSSSDYDASSGNFGVDNSCDDENPTDDWVLVSDCIPKYANIHNLSAGDSSANQSVRSSKSACRAHYLLTGGSDGHVTVVECITGSLVCDWLIKEPIACASWDGRAAIIGGQSGDLIIFDIAMGVTLSRVLAHPGGVTSLAVSECGGVLATGGGDHAVVLWGPRRPQAEGELPRGATA